MALDNFNAELTKVFCIKCKTFFFTHYQNRIENQVCAVCENSNENTRTVRTWEK